MQIYGSLTLKGGGKIENFRPDEFATDPASPLVGQMWMNTTEDTLKFFDGTAIWPLAKGGDLDNYLRRDGTNAMTGELELSSDDQSGAADTSAVSKKHVDTIAATKQDTITGAATSITSADLTADRAMVSDSSGKVAISAVTSAELGHLSGVTSGIQAQIDSKQDDLGYVPVNKAGDSMSGNLVMQGNAITGLPSATDPTSPITKADYDADRAGFNWQEDVKGVQEDNTLDPGTPAQGDRYIITDSTALHANFGSISGLANGDIVEFNGSEFVVAFDFSDAPNADGAMVWDQASQENYRLISGTWTPFYGLDDVVAGVGLEKNGNTLAVRLGAGIGNLPTGEVGVEVAGAGGLYNASPLDGSDSVATDAVLAIRLNGDSLETTSSGLAIKAAGVEASHVAAAALGNGLAGGEGVALNVKAHTGIVVTADGVAFDETYGDTRYINTAGDALTGALKGIAPVDAADLTRKDYVDTADAAIAQTVTDLNTKVENGHFVYDGTATAQASHVVAHNFNNKYVQVAIVDEADEVLLPDSIVFDDADNLTVSFTQAIKCRVIVTGANKA